MSEGGAFASGGLPDRPAEPSGRRGTCASSDGETRSAARAATQTPDATACVSIRAASALLANTSALLPGKKLEQLAAAIALSPIADRRERRRQLRPRRQRSRPSASSRSSTSPSRSRSSFIANGITVHNCSEYMFLDDTACNLASLNVLTFFDAESPPLRHRRLQARHPPLDDRAGNLRADGQLPVRRDRAAQLQVPHARPGLRQPRRDAHAGRHPLRQRQGPRHLRRAHRDPHRRELRHQRRDGRASSARSPATREQARHAPRHPQSPPRRVRRRAQRRTRPQALGDYENARHPPRRHRRDAVRRQRSARLRAAARTPPANAGTAPCSSARRTATATPRPPSSPPPAPSACSWTATPPASSPTSPW